MNLSFRIKSFVKFIIKAKPLAGYGIHSPFVYNFSSNILRSANKKNIPLIEIKKIKSRLKSDNRLLRIADYGANSVEGVKMRKVSKIVRRASTRLRYCRLLFKVAREMKPNTVIEFGTSLGISTIALSLAAPNAKILTIEGCEFIAKVAAENFKQLGLQNINQYIDLFDKQIVNILKEIQHSFILYIDGNHRYEPTTQYFEAFAELANNDSIIIIDDIHWSEEMDKAWKDICKHPKSTTKIDVYQMGIVFFKQGLPKATFNILY